MTSAEYYAAGYALPLYSIFPDEQRTWVFRDVYYLTTGVIQTYELEGLAVAKIEDVRASP